MLVIAGIAIVIVERGEMNWGTMSRDERDAAYNNTDAVKNSAELNAARDAASAAFRSAHPEHLDLPYGPRERNNWDLFPAADPNAPCLVFIHGGYWQRNSKRHVRQPDRRPARPWLGGGAAGLHPGARRHAHRDRGRDQRSARLAGGQRAGARHQRQGRAVGLVGRRTSDGAVPRPSRGSAPGSPSPACSSLGRSATPTSTRSCSSPTTRSSCSRRCACRWCPSRSPSPTARPSCRRWSATAAHLHAKRAAQHLPGPLIPVAGADHFTITHELRDADGELTRQLAAARLTDVWHGSCCPRPSQVGGPA